MAAVKAALEALIGNVVVRSIVLALVGALISVTMLLGKSKLGDVESAINKQSEAIKEQSRGLAGLETKIGDISEKLARVEERYVGHTTRIDEIATQVAELRQRLDQMAVERDMRLKRWEASMDRHDQHEGAEQLLRRVLRAIKERARNE